MANNISTYKSSNDLLLVDALDKYWSILVHLKPQDLYDMSEDNGVTFNEC